MKPQPITQADIDRATELMGFNDGGDPALKAVVTVKITGFTADSLTLGGGKYFGKMLQNEVAPTAASWLTDNLADTDLGFDENPDCYVLYYPEAGTSGHVLATNALVTGNVIGYTPDGGYIVAVTAAFKPFSFPVVLAQDGGASGSAGAAGTKPSWTYTLKDYDDGTTILLKADGTNATGLSPICPRLPAQAAAATAGLAYRKADGTLVLLEAYEDYSYGACT